VPVKLINLDDFVLEPAEINRIYRFIGNQYRPVQIRELAELIIRNRLEGLAAARNRRIYSPEQKYSVGEKIFFYTHEGEIVLAEVMKIEASHLQQYGPYKKITVSIQGCEKEKEYVSCCPNLPLRFKLPSEEKDFPHVEDQMSTPGQLATKYEERIGPILTEVLSKNDELAHVGDEWCAKGLLPSIRPDEVQLCYDYIKKRGAPVPSDELVQNVFKCSSDSPKFEIFRFSLDHHLLNDRKFVKYHSSEGIKWDVLKPIPPNVMRNTLDGNSIAHGYIKITRGLRALLEYSEVSDEIVFKSYGEYEIRGYIDLSLERIYGEEIKQWFIENKLKPGDIIYIKSPGSRDDHAVLFTAFEHVSDSRGKEKDKGKAIQKQKADLRHRIYNLLVSRREYLHVKEIHRLVGELFHQSVSLPTMEGILSANKHLFTRLPSVRGLWGLLAWEPKPPSIDPNSILLGINDEDWVIRILEQEGKPLTVAEMAERLSSVFIISKEKILELNFLDPNDERIVEFDGKWGLKRWIEVWKQRVKQIDRELRRYQDLRKVLLMMKEREKKDAENVLKLKRVKVLLHNESEKIAKQITIANRKFLDQEKHKKNLAAQLTLLNEEISRVRGHLMIPLAFVSVFLGALIAIMGAYLEMGMVILLAPIPPLCYLANRYIKKRFRIRAMLEKQREIKNNIFRLDKYLRDAEEERRIAEEKLAEKLKKIKLVENRVAALSKALEKVRNKVEDISFEVKNLNPNKLISERGSIIDLIKLAPTQFEVNDERERV